MAGVDPVARQAGRKVSELAVYDNVIAAGGLASPNQMIQQYPDKFKLAYQSADREIKPYLIKFSSD